MRARTLTEARERAGLTRRQLARLVGVAPSTVSRIEGGTLEPSFALYSALAEAAGCTVSVTRAVQDQAIAAARLLLGDPDVQGLDVGDWPERYAALGDDTDAEQICWRASRFASIQDRTGSEVWIDPSRIETVATAIEGAWAWTGSLAADRYVPNPTGTAWLTMYADEPERVAAAFQADARSPAASILLTVFPMTPPAAAGLVVGGDGQRWVAPLQAAIDCFGGIGRMRDQGVRVLGALGVGSGV